MTAAKGIHLCEEGIIVELPNVNNIYGTILVKLNNTWSYAQYNYVFHSTTGRTNSSIC